MSIPQVSVPTHLPVGKGHGAGTMGVDQLRPSGHIAALTFHDEFVHKYIGNRCIRDITFSNFIIVTVKCFPTTID